MCDPRPAPFNLAAHVLSQASARSDAPALCILSGTDPETWSFGRLERTVRGAATGLRNLGLEPGDRILMRLDNTVDFPVLYLAALAVDLIPVPTSAQLTVAEITALAAALRPRLTVAAPGIALPDAGRTPVLTLAGLRDLSDNPPADYAMGNPERPGYIVFTSGTSGKPRGVVHAHRAILARRAMVTGWYGLCDRDRMLHAGALNWTYTLGTGLLDPWTVGATALVPAPGTRPRDIAALLALHGATLFAAAPGVYRQMLRGSLPPLPALRHGLSAGEKLPEATRAAWQRATGTDIHEAFGMSECSTFLSGNPVAPALPGTLGRAQPGRRVSIRGDDGEAVPGTSGTIAVSAEDPGLMLGYLDDPAATQERMRDGWFLTGDIGAMDPDGTVRYLGRDDDMMNAGGFRVSPVEVEQALAEFPGLEDAAVVEVTVTDDTSVIAAFYTASADLDDVALANHCAGRLARYKCPRLFRRIDGIPSAANGKVIRRALRESFDKRIPPR